MQFFYVAFLNRRSSSRHKEHELYGLIMMAARRITGMTVDNNRNDHFESRLTSYQSRGTYLTYLLLCFIHARLVALWWITMATAKA
jgi:hypothetical protein